MSKIRLVHWNAAEAKERALLLEDLGHQVDGRLPVPPELVREMAENPPDALVIDLGRLPSQGRDVAVLVRQRKATRAIPIVFVDGDAAKVARIQQLLPDAIYTRWPEIAAALSQAMTFRPVAPVAPKSAFAAYAGVPLARKLGIRPRMRIGLIGAPEGFLAQLGDLPDGVQVREDHIAGCDLGIWFVRSRRGLDASVEEVAEAAKGQALWIAWPKAGSKLQADVNQISVRACGLANGLVDYKIASIDETWTGLLFRHRKGAAANEDPAAPRAAQDAELPEPGSGAGSSD